MGIITSGLTQVIELITCFMLRINLNLYPKDGYFFTERNGSRIVGESWKDVFAKVKAYRERNDLPEGRIEEEVLAQACSRNPHLCYSDQGTPVQPAGRPGNETLRSRVFNWLEGMVKARASGPLRQVSNGLAAQRAEICARCPFNVQFGETCHACQIALNEYRGKLIEGKIVDRRLGGCSQLGCDLLTAILLDEAAIRSDQLPANCWRKAT